MKNFQQFGSKNIDGSLERGSLTIFTALMVLSLMTLMVVYATRVSVLETKGSGNEVRHKEAFQVAEAAVDQGIMYFQSNAAKILSARENVFPDGTGFTGDGWFVAGSPRWALCTATKVALANHPCGGDIPSPVGSFYYDDPDTNTGIDSLPINEAGFPTGATARMSAVMCFVDLSNPGGGTCGGTPLSVEDEVDATLVVTLMAYGYSDCTNTASPSTCTAKSTVAMPVSNYKKLAGTPTVPLVTKSIFPPSGTAEIVGNPNGGGIGVPISVWVNANSACGPLSAIGGSGTWQTCEQEEWYHTADAPEGIACTDNNCKCGPGGNNTQYFLSWKKAGDTHLGIDIVPDADFPCDLFENYFGVPASLYQQVKSTARVMSDCSGLGPQSNGLIWISGSECDIGANTVVGSPNAPVILVSAATLTSIGSGADIFGVVYIFDGEDSSAKLKSTGSATIYGAIIVDAGIEKFTGSFQVVYSGVVVASASAVAGLGSLNGGWRDFGLPRIAW